MPTLPFLQWIKPFSASLLSLSLIAACGGSGPPQFAKAHPNAFSADREEISLDDGCAPLRSRFESVIDWMNCVGAALGAPPDGEASETSSVRYASISRRPKIASSEHAGENSLPGP
jgi:hypothetical protein